jgi:pimeloyl-ACP methyl ester carboxylesterase
VVLAVAALMLATTPAAAGDRHCVPSSNGWMNCLIESDPTDPLGTRAPLVLIHGWNAEGTPGAPLPEIWTNFLAYYQASPVLRAAYKPYVFAYYSNDVTVYELAAALRDVIDLASTDDPTNFGMKSMAVVAHSMGGSSLARSCSSRS